MFRTTLGLSAVAVLAAVAGCTMCCHPYDCCGPVYENGACQSCSTHYRTGSILSGTPEMTLSPEVARRDVQGRTASNPSPRGRVQGKTASNPAIRENVQGKTASNPILRDKVQGKTVSNPILQEKVQGNLKPGDVPGSERIVSVTDRVVKPSEASTDSTQVATESPGESAKPLPAQGWTARRPTPDGVQ